MCSRVPKIPALVCQNKIKSDYYLKKAEQLCRESKWTEAYINFVNYFDCVPDPSQVSMAVQLAFTKIVSSMGITLEEDNNTEELLKVYLQVLNIFPNNYVILNNLGAHLFQIGQVDIARRYLDLAVACCKNYLPAEKNLMHCKWQQLPRWHFRMLNDKKRNVAFSQSIRKAVDEGFHMVVDIGAGCGLLSLIAAKASPDVKVLAIEENKVIVKMMENILKENEITNVRILNEYSTKLFESPALCNLLVAEIFDVALFGERMLESLVHAHDLLITEEQFKIIPAGAKLYATGICCAELCKNVRYINNIPELALSDICIRIMDAETYDGEYLCEKDVKYLTNTTEVFDIDFYNVEQLTTLLNSRDFSKVIELQCNAEGYIHALAVWFDLNLDESISITTNPLDPNRVTCWEQAVFYLDHPVFVNKGDILHFEVTLLECQLKFTLLEEEKSCCQECWFVSKDIVSFLNDEKLVRAVISVMDRITVNHMTVLDMNVFPLLGILLAKKDWMVYTAIKEESNLEHVQFFEHIFQLNNIPQGKIVLLNQKTKFNPYRCAFHGPLKESQVFYLDPISVDGSLQQTLVYKDEDLQALTIVIPRTVKVKVVLISSRYLQNCNAVRDDNVLDFRIAKFINEYTGTEHPNIDHLPYVAYSSPVTFMLDDRHTKKTQNILATKTGTVNGLFTWYEITLYEDITFSTYDSSHYKKSCYLIKPKAVQLGDLFRVAMRREGNYLDFQLK